MFLISQIMDEARHMDVFRKRVFANGGGLMGQTTNVALSGGAIDSARDFTEMSARLHISGEGLVLSIFRMGELMSYNDAEKAIYRLAASDESRHVAFGVMHLQYLSQTDPSRAEEIHSYLDEIEMGLVIGAGGQNPATRGTLLELRAGDSAGRRGRRGLDRRGREHRAGGTATPGQGVRAARARRRLRRPLRERSRQRGAVRLRERVAFEVTPDNDNI